MGSRLKIARNFLSAILLTSLCVAADAPAPSPAAPARPSPFSSPPPLPDMFARLNREITNVKGDVYRASNNNGWYVGILDTPDGLLLVDTLNVEFAKWLKEELAKKFPGKQVKYVILSHSHWDHTEGGKIFADTAKFIAQEGFLRNMDGRYPALPGDITDRNNDGYLDPIEFDQPGFDRPWYCGGNGAVAQHDKDGDGRATPAEFFADTPRPDIVYSERMTIRFGGKTIDLVFPGKNHANDGTAVLFRDERVLFTTDFPADALVQKTMRSMPSACGPFDGHSMDEWIKSYRTIEALDFDISVGGHGTVPFTKADIAEGRDFFEYLKREVQDAMSKGMSLEQMKKTLMLEPYKSWRHYEQLRTWNIEAAYYNLKIFK
jgi:glyoxylase-like metal-dependent hydrolase (beta-lactamase superfamily II)